MMNENRETLADIVAQMRGRGEDGRMDMSLWRDYADRIEAAWKRERAGVEADALAVGGIVEAARTAEESSAVGNAKACQMTLNEAIAHAEDMANRYDTSCGREHRQLADWLKELRDFKNQPVGNAAAMREALNEIDRVVWDKKRHTKEEVEAHRLATEAMTVPARNCDIHATADEAMKALKVAFDESNFDNGECTLGCPDCEKSPYDCKVLWLFAPAASSSRP